MERRSKNGPATAARRRSFRSSRRARAPPGSFIPSRANASTSAAPEPPTGPRSSSGTAMAPARNRSSSKTPAPARSRSSTRTAASASMSRGAIRPTERTSNCGTAMAPKRRPRVQTPGTTTVDAGSRRLAGRERERCGRERCRLAGRERERRGCRRERERRRPARCGLRGPAGRGERLAHADERGARRRGGGALWVGPDRHRGGAVVGEPVLVRAQPPPAASTTRSAGAAASARTSPRTPSQSVASAVASWVNEEQYYDHATNSCASGQVCGHYTQIVWKNTTRVGCAQAHCTTNSPFGAGFPDWDMSVCDFSPPGNYVGEAPY